MNPQRQQKNIMTITTITPAPPPATTAATTTRITTTSMKINHIFNNNNASIRQQHIRNDRGYRWMLLLPCYDSHGPSQAVAAPAGLQMQVKSQVTAAPNFPVFEGTWRTSLDTAWQVRSVFVDLTWEVNVTHTESSNTGCTCIQSCTCRYVLVSMNVVTAVLQQSWSLCFKGCSLALADVRL